MSNASLQFWGLRNRNTNELASVSSYGRCCSYETTIYETILVAKEPKTPIPWLTTSKEQAASVFKNDHINDIENEEVATSLSSVKDPLWKTNKDDYEVVEVSLTF